MKKPAPKASTATGQEPPGEDQAGGDRDTVLLELAAARSRLTELEHERAMAGEREALLRNEAQHRVRNMLAIIRSIMVRTFAAAEDEDVENIAQHFAGRLDAIARSQVLREVNLGEGSDLESLVRDELKTFEFDQRITISGPDVTVPHDLAQLLTLAIHELATNSLKFGALSSDASARVHIGWTCANRLLNFKWQEFGVPIVSALPQRSGFGREFIEKALPYQVAATSTFEIKPGGITCTISVPLDHTPAVFRSWT